MSGRDDWEKLAGGRLLGDPALAEWENQKRTVFSTAPTRRVGNVVLGRGYRADPDMPPRLRRLRERGVLGFVISGHASSRATPTIAVEEVVLDGDLREERWLAVAASTDAELAFIAANGWLTAQPTPALLAPAGPSRRPALWLQDRPTRMLLVSGQPGVIHVRVSPHAYASSRAPFLSERLPSLDSRPVATRWADHLALREQAERLAERLSPGDALTRLQILAALEGGHDDEAASASGGRSRSWRRQGRYDDDNDGSGFEQQTREFRYEQLGVAEIFLSHGMVVRELGSHGVVGRPKARATALGIAAVRERLQSHCDGYSVDQLAASLSPGRPSKEASVLRSALVKALSESGIFPRVPVDTGVRPVGAGPQQRRRAPSRLLLAAALACSAETISALKRDVENSHEYSHKGGGTKAPHVPDAPTASTTAATAFLSPGQALHTMPLFVARGLKTQPDARLLTFCSPPSLKEASDLAA